MTHAISKRPRTLYTWSAIPAAIAGVTVNSAEIVERKPARYSGPVVLPLLFWVHARMLHSRLARDFVFSQAASNSIELVNRGELCIRHAGEFPAEIAELRFIQSIGVHGGHLKTFIIGNLIMFARC